MSLLKPKRTCRGLFYRYDESVFLDKRGSLTTTTRWVKLKRLSCRGCADCGGYDIEEDARNGDVESVEIEANRLRKGCVYALRWVKAPLSGPDFIDEGDGHWSATLLPIDKRN